MYWLFVMFVCYMIIRGMIIEYYVSFIVVLWICVVVFLCGIVWFIIFVCSNEMIEIYVFFKNFVVFVG